MARLQLDLRFIGTRYHGWQVQRGAITVQQRMQDAIQAVTGVRSPLTGCSRTDAGVHAAMFCCAFDTDSPLRGDKMAAALNAHLPADLAVTGCRERPEDFHPRYDAVAKRYVYRILNTPARDPFWEGLALHCRRPLDLAAMQRTAELFVGTHDFSAFCSAGSDVADRVRTVYQAEVARRGEMVTFTVTADGFLYNMVRIMVGTLLEAEMGRLSSDRVARALQEGKRDLAGHTAPPWGLYLDHVFYGEEGTPWQANGI